MCKIVAKPSPTCAVTLVQRDMGTYREWSLIATILPEKLELKNGDGLEYRTEGVVKRLGQGSMEYWGPWVAASKVDFLDGAIRIYIDAVPNNWIEEKVSVWEVEISIVLGPKRKRLYRGRPRRVKIESEINKDYRKEKV